MRDTRLMLRIAALYYVDGMTHQEIAQRFNVSRQTVGRLLHMARASGMIEIRIHYPRNLFVELESALERTYALKECVVVPSEADASAESLKAALGLAGAQYLAQEIRDGDILGLSWGVTLGAVAQYLEPSSAQNVCVVQLNGGLARGHTVTNASELVRQFSAAFHADSYGLNVPAIVDSTEICQAIYSDSNIRHTLDLAHQANVCVFSIGALSHLSVLVEAGYISADDVAALKAKGVVGDICSRYIDVEGWSPDAELNARTIGIELDKLRKKRTTVAIAGGLDKLDAIRGALAGRYCNVLITDEIVARSLLDPTADGAEKK